MMLSSEMIDLIGRPRIFDENVNVETKGVKGILSPRFVLIYVM